MKVLQIFNEYRSLCGGEELALKNIKFVLTRKRFRVLIWKRTSRDLDKNYLLKFKAFFSGIYNFFSYREMLQLLKEYKPNIVHVHNLYPLFSPSVIVACKKCNVPVVMTVHNYSITCPNRFHFRKGKICELCAGGKEYWCIFKNCRRNFFESIGYAIRTFIARKFRFYHNYVTLFIALTEFSKKRLIDAGIKKDQIFNIPHSIEIPHLETDPAQGEYVAFVGRISKEKGVTTLLSAAKMTGLPFRIAGDISQMLEIKKQLKNNIKWVGLLDSNQLDLFYRNARFLVVPSLWYETFGFVVVEAMARGIPVIASNIGGLPYIVDDGVTGFLFEPGNSFELSKKIMQLWNNKKLCKEMGRKSREKALREYNINVFADRLLYVYKKALEQNAHQG